MSMMRHDEHEGFKDVMNIVFREGDCVLDMEVRLYEEAGEDHLIFSVTDQTYLQKYYEETFTIFNIPRDFITIFGTLQELYEHIATSYEESLQLYVPDDAKESIIIFLNVLIINKIKKFKLVIESKPLTELMKEENNLKKLTYTIEDKRKMLERVILKESDTNKIAGISEREIERLKGEETELVDRFAAQVELEQIQDDKHKELLMKLTQKQREVSQMYQELVKEGFAFTEAEINEFSKATQSLADRKNGRRMIIDKSGQVFPQIKEELIVTTIDPKRKSRTQNEVQVLNCEEVFQANIANSKLNKSAQKDKNKQINLESYQRRLRLTDSDDSLSKNPFISLDKQKKAKEHLVHKPQSNNHSQCFMNSQENIKNLQQKASANVVTVLSSQSQEQQHNDSNKEVGVKVTLDFSQSQNIDKYKLEVIKSKTYIQRINDDKNYYHIYHRYPIKDKQNMQISIYHISKGDFTFGVMSKEALQVSRLAWTKECICWLGATREICNQLKCSKIQQKMETSDLITVAVDCSTRTIYFYLNRKFVYREKIPEKMINQCYFFIQTATKGNKVYYL